MRISDFVADEKDKVFFKKAAKIIYDWLPPDKKNKFGRELSDDGVVDPEDLKEYELFFKLLNFLETNYIRVGFWARETLDRAKNIGSDKNSAIQDVEMTCGKEKVRLSRISVEHQKSGIEEIFQKTVEELGLQKTYQFYIKEGLEATQNDE
jgi:hypothetical protein